MQSVMITVLVCAFMGMVFLYSRWEAKNFEKKRRLYLRKNYGKINEGKKSGDPQNISIYYNLRKEAFPEEELVDEITWNDLEMDSIFEDMNTTMSFAGEQVLYSELHRLPVDKSGLKGRERMIRFYSTHQKEREDAQLLLMRLKKEEINYFIPEYMGLLEMQRIPFIGLCKVLSCTLVLLLLAAIITTQPLIGGLAFINFTINVFLYAVGKSKYEVFLETLYGVIHTVKSAKRLSVLHPESSDVKEKVKELDKIAGMVVALERKKQAGITGDIAGLISDYLIGAFMWDFIMYDKVVRSLMGRQKTFMQLLDFVGEIDLCIAVASYREMLGAYCLPQFSEDELCMQGIYHPLIPGAVTNSLEMDHNILLTGSNASGKSTFIKAIAVNVILGQNIHTCAAEYMVIPNARVMTSMAVRDDILSGESYYMKEIKYLERMIAAIRGKRMVICGIDEILRGTNVMERVAASIAILNYLAEENCIVMVASHDHELARTLADKYINYYFCETVEDGDVVFDYKLRAGISNTFNAIRLLQTVGFPREIVGEARKRCTR